MEDTLSPHLKADHYVLVTGYDLSGESNFILGLVSNIPSVCQLDSVSLTELWLPFTASIMAHELGHSLGADHDGLTNGFCQDDQQFIMAAVVGGAVPEQNVGNSFRYINCFLQFFPMYLSIKSAERKSFSISPKSILCAETMSKKSIIYDVRSSILKQKRLKILKHNNAYCIMWVIYVEIR